MLVIMDYDDKNMYNVCKKCGIITPSYLAEKDIRLCNCYESENPSTISRHYDKKKINSKVDTCYICSKKCYPYCSDFCSEQCRIIYYTNAKLCKRCHLIIPPHILKINPIYKYCSRNCMIIFHAN